MATTPERFALIEKIRSLPQQVQNLIEDLTDKQLTTPYIPGEWTVAQNIHHLADSHMNSYIRCKLIATEDHPTLKPYNQEAWAEFPDSRIADISVSMMLLRSLHARWTLFWQELPADAWDRTGFHPENGTVTLDNQLRLYAAHGEAHLDQIARTLAAQSVSSVKL